MHKIFATSYFILVVRSTEGWTIVFSFCIDLSLINNTDLHGKYKTLFPVLRKEIWDRWQDLVTQLIGLLAKKKREVNVSCFRHAVRMLHELVFFFLGRSNTF
uniref:Putative secreted protein salivary gland overexpressed n=1 Tax=Rhipicephalus microplus TaxID=6941 RepID=A0A6M2DC97_RHIMP